MKLVKLALAMVLAMSLVACNASQFQQYLNAVTPAVSIILQIIAIATGQPYSAGLASKVGADVSAVEKLYSDFQSASALNKPGVETDINAGFATLDADLNQVFALAQVSDKATQQKLAALIGLVQQGCALAESLVPQPNAPMKATNIHSSPKDLVSSFNAILKAKTGNPTMDSATAKMKVGGGRHWYFAKLR